MRLPCPFAPAMPFRLAPALPTSTTIATPSSWPPMAAPLTAAVTAQAHTASFGGETMGTSYQVRLVVPPEAAGLLASARAAVHAALDAVDRRMSTYRADSELSALNRHAPERPLAVSADTLRVLTTARAVSEATDGAFDVTAGSFVNAWGFGPHKHQRRVGAHELAALKPAVGHEQLLVSERSGTVVRTHPRLYADLSAIAKGYGVDQAARALQALGFAHFVVEAGGEVLAQGRRADGRAWQVGIEQPQAGGARRARYAVALSGLAMATSGDYRIGFDHAGRRYSHEIDPRTGCPIDNTLTSVTVVAAECALADAFATGLIVLGPQAGFERAERLGLAAYFVQRDADGRLHDRMTSAFAALPGRALHTG
jgi:thiamine biosynthesis lipoprotein